MNDTKNINIFGQLIILQLRVQIYLITLRLRVQINCYEQSP